MYKLETPYCSGIVQEPDSGKTLGQRMRQDTLVCSHRGANFTTDQEAVIHVQVIDDFAGDRRQEAPEKVDEREVAPCVTTIVPVFRQLTLYSRQY
jgi:hypothetical protein